MSTRDQALVSGALSELKFEPIPAEGGVVGGPSKLKVTEKTLKLLKDGTVVTVSGDGSVKTE